MDKEKILTKLTDAGLVAVVRAKDGEEAIKISDACLEGGCPSIELTFTVPGAHKVIEELAARYQGGETFYQTEGEDEKTVLVTGADRSESGLVRTSRSPVYQGAVVVCRGADSPAVRLAIVEAVANATGLGTDRITVLKMK